MFHQDENGINGDTEDEYFSLQELYDYINRTLWATEETKKTLQMECEEARYALKPWPIESTIIRKLDMNVCTCDEVRKNLSSKSNSKVFKER